MKKRSKSKMNEEVSYWQSSTDILAALLLVLLLIVMILLLYLVSMPENDQIDPDVGDETTTEAGSTEDDWYDREHNYDHTYNDNQGEVESTPADDDDDDDGGGGGNGGDGPNIGIYDGTGPGDGLGKTAVYVMVVDEDTHQTIKEAGITYELHIMNQLKKEWQLAVLNTYYPVEIEYRNFETTEEGIFFLPEKVYIGDYKFHQLTAPYGYDIAEDFEFKIDEAKDWSEPVIITIPLSPAKNIIRVQMNDRETKEALEGGTFYIYAAEDIITKDGTTRYKKGEVVSEITCDEKGYAESEELYLGKYQLVQKDIPEFYAAEADPIEVEVVHKVDGLLPKLNQVWSDKTAFTVSVSDELYANVKLSGCRFSVSYYLGNNRTDYYETDEFGEIKLTNLAKNTLYHVKQLSTLDGYNESSAEIEVSVDENGRINGEVTPSYTISNRMHRIKVNVTDIILQNQVSDMNITLFTESGEVHSAWDSTGMANLIEGIEAGNYYILINGQDNSRKDITVHDTEEIQNITLRIWTGKSITAIAILIVFLILIIFLILWYLIRHREERKEKKERRREEKRRKKDEKLRLKEEKRQSKNE